MKNAKTLRSTNNFYKPGTIQGFLWGEEQQGRKDFSVSGMHACVRNGV